MAKTPSPCIDVCKYRREGHCIGCSMTKVQKSMFKQLRKGAHRSAFVTMLMAQQQQLGKFDGWRVAYAKKCTKKGAKAPFEVT